MGNKIAAMLVAAILYAVSLHAENTAPVTQSSSGNQSPNIIAGRDATVNFGLKKEEYRQMLREELQRATKERLKPSLTAEERRLLEQKIKALEEKNTNLQKSYEEELTRRKSAGKALEKLQGQLSPARLEEAGRLLQEGDTTAAEQVFDEVVDKEGKSVALAAYQSGQLAKGHLDYAKAMRQYKKSVALEEDNPDYLLAAEQMALTMADYDRAQEWLERLLKLREKDENNRLALARVQHDLAWCYEEQGEYGKAESFYKRSLEIRQKAIGKKHSSVAATRNNLAGLYRLQGRYKEAESAYKHIIDILKKYPKKNHLNLAVTLNNLAGLYEYQKRYKEAEHLYHQAIFLLIGTGKKQTLQVVAIFSNLAGIYKVQGRYEKTEHTLKTSLEIIKDVLGENHPTHATLIQNLATLYREQARYEEAEPLYKSSLKVFEQALGKEHPAVALNLWNLAVLYQQQGKYNQANSLYQRALYIFTNNLPAGHPYIREVQAAYDLLKLKMVSSKRGVTHRPPTPQK